MDPVIREDGSQFPLDEVERISDALSSLEGSERAQFLETNGSALAGHASPRLLIVSGPGTGKSFAFRSRIKHWLGRYPGMRIAVSTFVRKLARDLRSEIANDKDISHQQRAVIEVNTLHAIARSIIERTNGTSRFSLAPYCKMIVQPWDKVVWRDVIGLHSEHRLHDYTWEDLQEALHDGEVPTTGGWSQLREDHLRLQQYYNALTFPDLIILATEVVAQNPELARETLFIFDEFQDFNLADEALIVALTAEAPGLLLVGDDDQTLYQDLRRSHPSIIRRYYADRTFVNAMLPYCMRCGPHIANAADAFLNAGRPKESIPKVFVPFEDDGEARHVSVVAATSPKAAVEYVERFLLAHSEAIRERQHAISAGDATEPYLLILTPARKLKFLDVDGARQRLWELLRAACDEEPRLGEDYWRLFDYLLAARAPTQNFFMRRVLEHEGIDGELVCEWLRRGLTEKKNLIELQVDAIARCARKCAEIRALLEGEDSVEDKIQQLECVVSIENSERLLLDLSRFPMQDDLSGEDGVLFDKGTTSAVELTTIVGSKGLSADHVIVLGCDDVNLARTTRNAFFVAITRARIGLVLMAAIGGGGAKGLHDFVMALPNSDVRASMSKVGGEQVAFSTISDLQGHLEKWQYAKERAQQARASRLES